MAIKARLLRCLSRHSLRRTFQVRLARTRQAPCIRTFLTILLNLVFIFSFPSPAEARIYIQIDQPSAKRFPIAIVNLVADHRGESKDWSRKITEMIKNDLELTGLFEVIPSHQYSNSPGARSIDPSTIAFPPWTLIGAQALVNGSYTSARGGMIKGGVQINLHLYDPFLGQHLIGRTYVTNEKEMSIVAHNFADEIMKELTGERGVFSTKIAYVQVMKKIKEIGAMNMDGSNSHLITKDKTIDLSPAWSPDGSRIAYTSFVRGGAAEVVVIGSSGGTPKHITANGTINVSPTWTPSGVLTVASAMTGDTEIYLMNLAGDVVKRLTNSFGIDVNPSWSPDGSEFVFASERAGRLHLFKADTSGGGVERLTFVGVQNDNPVWSPKGDKIVFQSLDNGWDLFIMNTDGGVIQRLTSTGNNESPSWAPNGRFITFSTGSQVAIMREDGSSQKIVGPKGSLQPSWGPWVK